MLPIKIFRTLALSSTNPAEAERFYTEVLGGKVVDRYEPTEGSRRPGEAMVQLGDFKVALADASAGPLDGFPHYTLIAEHRPKDELLAEFESAGVKVESVRDHADGQGYSCTIRDPDGHLLELWLSRQNV
jgi:catechol 2,3-dioxygenase-like lactoylglutathione lyase family enzyme